MLRTLVAAAAVAAFVAPALAESETPQPVTAKAEVTQPAPTTKSSVRPTTAATPLPAATYSSGGGCMYGSASPTS